MQHGHLKKFFVVMLALHLFNGAAAQADSSRHAPTKKHMTFQGIVAAGVVSGASGRDAVMQLLCGWSHRGWFAGPGVGLDYYNFRSLPFFLELRKTFSKAHTPFLYADAGLNVPWIKKAPGTGYRLTYKSGGYFEAGAGWAFPLRHANHILLSGGYTIKKLTENGQLTGDTHLNKTYYTLRRLVFKAGFQF